MNSRPFLIGMSYLFFVGLLGLTLSRIGVALGKKGRMHRSGLSAFECGFEAMSSPRIPFCLQFYLISIIFLLFDLELILVFPFLMSMAAEAEVMLFVFLGILLLGLVHEHNEGSLEWKEVSGVKGERSKRKQSIFSSSSNNTSDLKPEGGGAP